MIYQEHERQIFQYLDWEGKPRFADPLRIQKLLSIHSGDRFNSWVQERNSIIGESNRPEGATARANQLEILIVEATAKSFGTHLFDPQTGKGANDEYLFSLICNFLDYLEKKENPPVSGRTSTPCAGCQ